VISTGCISFCCHSSKELTYVCRVMYKCLCVCVDVCIHMCVYMFMYLYECMYVCMFVYVDNTAALYLLSIADTSVPECS